VVECVDGDGDGDKLMMDRYCLRIRRARMLRIIRGRWMLRRRGREQGMQKVLQIWDRVMVNGETSMGIIELLPSLVDDEYMT